MPSGIASEIATLESRRLLAGTTAVTFSAGVLTLTCADDLTQVGILAGKNDNQITLTGGVAGAVTLSGAGELFTGAGQTFTGVTKINVIAKEGDDSVTFTNVNITGAATVTGGNGNNSVSGNGGSLGSLAVTNLDGVDWTSYANATIVGACTISNGDGGVFEFYGNYERDGSYLSLNSMTVGSLSVTSLDGWDSVSFNGNTTVKGTTTISTGTGGSIIDTDGLGTLGGALAITNGDGFDDATLSFISTKAITITNGNGGSNTVLSTSSPIVGNVTITNLDGKDEFSMGDTGEGATNITGNLTISNGNGTSTTDLKTNVSGNLSISGLAGADNVTASEDLRVTGTTTFNFGSGISSVFFVSTGTLNFGGALTITSTSGDDYFEVSSPNPIAFKSVTLSLGNGNTRTNLQGTITGNLSITSLAGSDEVAVPTGLTVTGTTTFNFGSGDSNVSLASAGALNFGGAISVTSTDGDDAFTISSGYPIALKGVTLSQGNGNTTTYLQGTITGNLSITSLNGVDNVGLANTLVTGTTTINTGGGGSDIWTEGSGTLGGALTITNADGYNSAKLDFISTKAITVNNGNGGSETLLRTSSPVVGNVTITNMDGLDSFSMGDTGEDATNITGNLTISNGNGTSYTDLKANITGNLSVSGLADEDHVSAREDLRVTGTTTFSFGSEDSDVDFVSTGTLYFGGAISVTSTDGDDFFVISSPNAVVLKAVTINSGLGDSYTRFSSGELASITMDALSLIGGSGFHEVSFDGSLVTTKNITLNFQGDSFVTGYADLMTINGNLAATLASSLGSALYFNGALNVTGTTTAMLGAGDDAVFLVGGGTLTGAVTITGNAGGDSVGLHGVTVVGNMTTLLGTGSDLVTVEDSVFKGTVTLTLGAGDDQVLIEQEDTGIETRFEKAVKVTGDAGADLIFVGRNGDLNDNARFLSTVSIDGGLGIDRLFALPFALSGTRSNIFTVLPSLVAFEVQL